jgi:hypothetical protein
MDLPLPPLPCGAHLEERETRIHYFSYGPTCHVDMERARERDKAPAHEKVRCVVYDVCSLSPLASVGTDGAGVTSADLAPGSSRGPLLRVTATGREEQEASLPSPLLGRPRRPRFASPAVKELTGSRNQFDCGETGVFTPRSSLSSTSSNCARGRQGAVSSPGGLV